MICEKLLLCRGCRGNFTLSTLQSSVSNKVRIGSPDFDIQPSSSMWLLLFRCGNAVRMLSWYVHCSLFSRETMIHLSPALTRKLRAQQTMLMAAGPAPSLLRPLSPHTGTDCKAKCLTAGPGWEEIESRNDCLLGAGCWLILAKVNPAPPSESWLKYANNRN